MDSSRKTGAAFVGHWDYARRKGLMNASTAKSLEASCRRVLETQDDWQNIDIDTLDVDDLLHRFRNLNASDFKPRSLTDYEQRFRRAISSYQSFLENPSAWKYSSRRAPSRRSSTASANASDGQRSMQPPELGSESPIPSSYAYTYPFRKDFMAKLEIPRDATSAEIDRLVAWARTLAIDYDPSA